MFVPSLLNSQTVADGSYGVGNRRRGSLLIVGGGQVGDTIRSGRQFHSDCGHEHIVQRPERSGGGLNREFSLLHLGYEGRRNDATDGQRRRLGRIPGMKYSLARSFHRKQRGVDVHAATLGNRVQADVGSGAGYVGGCGALIEGQTGDRSFTSRKRQMACATAIKALASHSN